jgi:hypothetical protein
MQTPHESHWKTTKMILWFIQGTIHSRIHYSLGGNPLFVGFIDPNWDKNLHDQNSVGIKTLMIDETVCGAITLKYNRKGPTKWFTMRRRR